MKKKYILITFIVIVVISIFTYLNTKTEYARIDFNGKANQKLLKQYSTNQKIFCDKNKEYEACFIYIKRNDIKIIKKNKNINNVTIIKKKDIGKKSIDM